jgi:hypothetical protein
MTCELGNSMVVGKGRGGLSNPASTKYSNFFGNGRKPQFVAADRRRHGAATRECSSRSGGRSMISKRYREPARQNTEQTPCAVNARGLGRCVMPWSARGVSMPTGGRHPGGCSRKNIGEGRLTMKIIDTDLTPRGSRNR